jgi:hypothetical protein
MSTDLRRIAAGRYEYRGKAIVKTDWDGPRGGTIYRWETGQLDADGVVTIDGYISYGRLRDAVSAIDSESGPGEADTVENTVSEQA